MEYKEFLRTPLKNKLFGIEKKFLYELNNYLDTPIYLYGSILRSDYFPDKSDIDLAIFANDIPTIIDKLVIFLGINKSKIKVFKFETNKQTIYGYKTNYVLTTPCKIFFYDTFKRFEISLYNLKDKDELIKNNIKQMKPPFLIALQLFIIKYLYYYMYLNNKYYKRIKENIFNSLKDYNNKITIVASL